MKNLPVLGASLLIAGTSIGAAMLALPLASVEAGFIYSLGTLILSWFFMYSTGLCIIEVASAFKKDSGSFIEMARQTLGPWGARLTALSFFCLLYALLAAYITGGGDIVQKQLEHWGNTPSFTGALLWTTLFAAIIYYGVTMSDRVNRVLMLALFVIYGILSFDLGKHVESAHFLTGNLRYTLMALPIIFTAHGYHVVLPSVYHYLDQDSKRTRQALFWGSMIPLVLYIVWEYIVFGAIPSERLWAIAHSPHTTTDLIETFSSLTHNTFLKVLTSAFVFFAIASSFLGVSLGLFDLVKDMMPKSNYFRKAQVILTFLPSLLFGILYPSGFVLALNYAGIFVAILHGFLPVLMVLSKRYHLKLPSTYTLMGGLGLQIFLLLFYIAVIVLDVFFVAS